MGKGGEIRDEVEKISGMIFRLCLTHIPLQSLQETFKKSTTRFRKRRRKVIWSEIQYSRLKLQTQVVKMLKGREAGRAQDPARAREELSY